jgi:hypothetical protein
VRIQTPSLTWAVPVRGRQYVQEPVLWRELTGFFCTSESEREFTLEGSWYADEEIQAGADRDAAAAG